jgi:predicted dinucleotide-binding enzyme
MNLDHIAERRLGVVGAGKLGTTISRAALEVGYEVAISGSGSPERIALIVDVLAPGAHVMTSVDVVARADIIVLAVPAHRFRELSRDLFHGKILIDAMNYWEPIDGFNDEFAHAPHGTSALVQEWFSSARVVKAFNQLGYHEIEEMRRPSGDANRVAIAVAGNDETAVSTVMRLVDELGFDPLPVGSLEDGVALQPEGFAFGVALTASELSGLLWPALKRA